MPEGAPVPGTPWSQRDAARVACAWASAQASGWRLQIHADLVHETVQKVLLDGHAARIPPGAGLRTVVELRALRLLLDCTRRQGPLGRVHPQLRPPRERGGFWPRMLSMASFARGGGDVESAPLDVPDPVALSPETREYVERQVEDVVPEKFRPAFYAHADAVFRRVAGVDDGVAPPSIRESAAELGVTEEALRRRLSRALVDLRDRLRRDDPDVGVPNHGPRPAQGEQGR